MMGPAIRFITAKGHKVKSGSIQLLCLVKPGVNAKRQGIEAVTDDGIELCVAAQAREGEANKAVRELIAEVKSPNYVAVYVALVCTVSTHHTY